jgi:hypothetical protein
MMEDKNLQNNNEHRLYKPPQLVEYGDLVELTKSGSGSLNDLESADTASVEN